MEGEGDRKRFEKDKGRDRVKDILRERKGERSRQK
jgi:hypothetical protein